MKSPGLKIIFWGTPAFVLPVFLSLKDHFQLIGIVTAPDQPVGRKQILTPSPVAKLAEKYGLPVFKPVKLDEEFAQNLAKLAPDLFVVAAYGKIIPQNILDLPKFGALNIHPSLLPKYRGPSPLQAAILNGDEVSGVSVMKMDAKMDHGPLVSTRKVSLSEQYNYQTLGKKMFEEGASLLVNTIPDFVDGKIALKPQNDQKATYTKMISKEDGYFDLSSPPKNLDKMIRAYYPWPTAWTKWASQDSEQAKVVKLLPGGLVQMEGKKPVPLKDFLHGYPSFPLKSLY